jgi:hypothetical protein
MMMNKMRNYHQIKQQQQIKNIKSHRKKKVK